MIVDKFNAVTLEGATPGNLEELPFNTVSRETKKLMPPNHDG